jgi:tripartite-type tricarboxylate transporter receptor subunit TctC
VKLPRRQILQLAAGAVALPAVSRGAWAQAYPARPITLVVPFAAGGPTDTIARIMGERMRASLGQISISPNPSATMPCGIHIGTPAMSLVRPIRSICRA